MWLQNLPRLKLLRKSQLLGNTVTIFQALKKNFISRNQGSNGWDLETIIIVSTTRSVKLETLNMQSEELKQEMEGFSQT